MPRRGLHEVTDFVSDRARQQASGRHEVTLGLQPHALVVHPRNLAAQRGANGGPHHRSIDQAERTAFVLQDRQSNEV